MPRLTLVIQRSLTTLLIALVAVPTITQAQPKPLDPQTVHYKIMKRGVNNWIALQESDGVQLFGRILDIGDHSFTLQLHNDPRVTEILYADVEYLQTGWSTTQKVIALSGLAAVAGGAIYGIVHLHNLENKPLQPPTPPPFP